MTGTALTWSVALVLGALTFAFRYLSFSDFANDHFVHLSTAQQLLLGALPVRDFVERGMPLMTAMSAAAQIVLGQGLWAELMLIAAAFAVSAAVVFVVAAAASRSRVAALAAAVATVVASPIGYAYPKHLVYAIAFGVAWWYGREPRRVRLVALAVAVAAAFYVRHDHGLLLAAGSVAFLVALHRRSAARPVAFFAGVVLLCVAPFLIWVQAYEGVGNYVHDGIEFSKREADRTRGWWPPPPFALGRGEPMPLLENAVALLYWFLWATPPGCLAVLLASRAVRHSSVAPLVLMAAVVQLGLNVTMLRDPVAQRIRDALVPAVLVAAIGAAALWRAGHRGSLRGAARVAVVAVLAMFVIASASAGSFGERVDRANVRNGVAGMRARARQIGIELAPPRHRTGRDDSGYVALAEYVAACTTPDARVFAMTFAPELFFYANRGFAGGHVTLTPGYYVSDRHAALMLSRLSRENVPLVIVDAGTHDDYVRDYPRVTRFVAERYREAWHVADPRGDIVVWADATRRPTGTWGAGKRLPCFATVAPVPAPVPVG